MVVLAEEKIVLEFKNIALVALLVILLFFLALELSVTFQSPISFGDEAYHTGMARYIAKEVDYPKWVTVQGTDIGRDNFGKPPMLHLIESGFFLIFGFNEGIVKFLLPFISFLTAIAIYILTKRLLNEVAGFIAALVFFTIPSIVTYSVTFFTEGLVTLYIALSVLLFILSMKSGRKKYLLLSGAFFGFAFLTEVSSVVLIGFFVLAFLYGISKGHRDMQKYGTILLIFVIFTSGFLIRNLALYGTPGCYLPFTENLISKSGCTLGVAIQEQVFQYQSITGGGGSNDSVYQMGILNYLNFAYGNIWLVTIGVLGGMIIALHRKDLVSVLLVLMIITIIPYFHFTTSRAEDAARNLLAWSSFIAIFSGIYFSKIYEFLKSYQKYIAPAILIAIIVLAYQNLEAKLATMSQVKRFSPAFFEACNWVKENIPTDAVISTVWVHRTAYSCERTAVGNPPDIFLSKDLELIQETVNEVGITHLFIQKFSLGTGDVSERYRIDVVQFFEDNPEHFEKLYENGPRLSQCVEQGGCDGNILYEVKF